VRRLNPEYKARVVDDRHYPVSNEATNGPTDPVEARASAIAKRLLSMPPQPRKPAKPAKKKGG
jgi:hypothetical protein